MTQKSSGCDHLQCPSCGTHWCFFCGQAKPEREIYAHMANDHGGWFDGQEYDDDFDDELSDEEW